ncbi:hypothetical protein KF707C_50350 [Metapseudomonas furukawaii]|uniref:Uncharacterized protein n=1 Tax=Metapseudomonas furukawaii TaxID=1149133 RepID=A0AAD1FIJ4_METFU|nr:hypothetical protein KF707C_50350 [Pseudomonas furukawaii]
MLGDSGVAWRQRTRLAGKRRRGAGCRRRSRRGIGQVRV